MKLVGIYGHAGAGKNTFAEEFHYFRYLEFAFADPVKQICKTAFGFSDQQFVNRILKETDDEFWNLSPRKAAQLVGTELFRNKFGNDFWICCMQRRIHAAFASPQDTKVVITDVRFANEAQFILSNGGVLVHLTREGYEGNVGIPGHASEQKLDINSLITVKENQIEVIENNGSINDLKLKAQQFIRNNINLQ